MNKIKENISTVIACLTIFFVGGLVGFGLGKTKEEIIMYWIGFLGSSLMVFLIFDNLINPRQISMQCIEIEDNNKTKYNQNSIKDDNDGN